MEVNEGKLANRTHFLMESEASAGSPGPTCDWRKDRRLVSTREVPVLHNSDVVMQIIELKIFKLYVVLLINSYIRADFFLNKMKWEVRFLSKTCIFLC